MKETDQVYMHIPLWVQTYENEDGRMVPSVVHFNRESYKVMGPPLSVRRLQGLETLGMDYVEYTVMIAVKPGSKAARRKRLIYNAKNNTWLSIKPVSRLKAKEIREDRGSHFPQEYYRSLISESVFLVERL